MENNQNKHRFPMRKKSFHAVEITRDQIYGDYQEEEKQNVGDSQDKELPGMGSHNFIYQAQQPLTQDYDFSSYFK